MKPIIYTRLGVITLLCCCSSIVLAEALIIEDGTVNAQIEVLDEYQAEQERLKALINNQPPAYVDKVMKQGNLTSDSETVDDRTQPEGLRSYYLESRMYTRDSNNLANTSTSTNDWTLRGEYRQQTLNYGEWIAQGEIHNQTIDNTTYEDKKSKQNRLTLLNHDLPLTSAIKADSALGDFNGGITEALERQARFSLGNSNVRGVGTRIKGETFELRAGSGKRGVWESTPYASFRESQGTLQWLGYSKELSKNINTGVQYNRATQVKSNDTELTTTLDSLAATINYQPKATETRSTQARLTGVKSKSLEGKTSQGLFAEGAFYQGHYYHEWGAFFSEPDLYFGNNLLADDNHGGYWRTSYHSSHLNMGMGIDMDETPATIENAGNKRVSLNVNAQKRLDLNNTLSGNITYHHNDYDQVSGNNTKAQSLNTHLSYERKTVHNGTTRLNLQLRRQEQLVKNDIASTGEELNWEQTWNDVQTTDEPALTTSVGIAQDRSTNRTVYPTAGVNIRGWLDDDWSVNTNLRYSARHSNLSTSQGLSGAVSTERAINNAIQLGASLSLNEAKIVSNSTLLGSSQVSRSRDKSVSVYLRWNGSHGKPFNTLGRHVSNEVGFGTVRGVVFTDLNQDGKQQLDEVGLANIEVLLDGRYTVRTDNNGHYSLYAVATGKHQLTLNLDTVPLPWGEPDNTKPININVLLRENVFEAIPVVAIKN